jgi:hypothetical protein
MADQGRWFKVWTSILDDPHFQELSLEDIGRWVLLGAMTKFVGTRGTLTGNGEARRLCQLLRCSRAELARVVDTLPHVTFSDAQNCACSGACTCAKNRYGTFTVTFQNWLKYQEDSTAPQRMRALRAKKRRDKKRSTIPPTPLSGGSDPEGFSTPPVGSAGGPRRALTPEQRQTYLAAVEARRRESSHGDQPD